MLRPQRGGTGHPIRTNTIRDPGTNEAELKALPDSKAEAKEQGAKFYYTGEPCGNGHRCERSVMTGCVECTANREKRNAGGKKMPNSGYEGVNKKNSLKNDAFQKYSKNYQRGK